MWGAISGKRRSGLWLMPEETTKYGAPYLDVLKQKLPPFMAIHDCNTFQHDGAPCHQTKAVKEWLAQNNIEFLSPWPGNSPDLNPIENCWLLLKRKVAARNSTSLKELKKAIVSVCVEEISPEYCEKLCLSMRARIANVIASKGKHTKY